MPPSGAGSGSPFIKYWKLGIIGWPLGYSLSPLMHERALKAAGFAGRYQEYPVRPEELPIWLDRVNELGLDGFNVTMPHKIGVWDWVVSHGRLGHPQRDAAIGALNTVAMKEGRPTGYNTDGEGFLRPLVEAPRSLDLSGWCVVVLGAGGAARAIVATLALQTKVSRISLWNRDPVRARMLAQHANSLRGKEADFARAEEKPERLPVSECQLLVNATSYGMHTSGQEPLLVNAEQIHPGQVVYDIVYESRQTALIGVAQQRGAQVIRGEEMLAGQGAVAFEIWTGKKGMLPVMRRVLDDHFSTSS